MESRINVGIDLHKTQFTVCILFEDEELAGGKVFRMDEEGYDSFILEKQLPKNAIILAIYCIFTHKMIKY